MDVLTEGSRLLGKLGGERRTDDEAVVKRLCGTLRTTYAALEECEEYFDNRSDVLTDSEEVRPNKEMRLLMEVKEALDAVERGWSARAALGDQP